MTAPRPTCGTKPWSLPKKIGIVGSLAVAIALTVAQLLWPRLDPEEKAALDEILRCRAQANDPIFDPGMRRLAQTPCDMLAQQYIARYGRKP